MALHVAPAGRALSVYYLRCALRTGAENDIVQGRVVLSTLGIGWDRRRHVLAVKLAGRDGTSSWKQHLQRPRERGPHGVQLAASDDHAGLKPAIMEALPKAYWQRGYVQFLRNALD